VAKTLYASIKEIIGLELGKNNWANIGAKKL
jgi:hypothetical protein